ncbi:MAG: hypothetical protein EKK53_15830 [Burkholderiales bacterium]|nr:MAG: hypothetical protein EKK53_15830 [Burkholderiales bacterium]
MAYTFLVLASRDALPTAADLNDLLARERLPAVIETGSAWAQAQGWLPMTWREAASGCEVELSKLSKRDAAAAAAVGQAGCNVAVAITSRGWDSLQCAVCFAAALAVSASGCISEEDEPLIPPDAAWRWARETVSTADDHRQREQAHEAATAAALAEGGVEARFSAALAALAGREVQAFGSMLMSHLSVSVAAGPVVAGAAWQVRAEDGTVHANNRHSALRTRQARLLPVADTADGRRELAALEKQLAAAARQDEQGAKRGLAEVQRWPAGLKITSATWQAPNQLTLQFANGAAITFTGGLFGEVSCSLPPQRYRISDEGPRLV